MGFQPMVAEDMRSGLAKPFMVEEVEVAIKDMAPSKASGLDGLPPLFYQTY